MTKQLHHKVPRFLLRQFTVGRKRKQVFTYDKSTDRSFTGSIDRLAAERGYYDFEFKEHLLTIEPGLAKLESRAAKHFKQITNNGHLGSLTDDAYLEISHFLAAQLARTENAQARQLDIKKKLVEFLSREGMDPSYFEPPPELGDERNAEKTLQIRHIVDSVEKSFGHFVDKDWVLLSTDNQHPFMLGDNPVTLYNSVNMSPYGNLGIAVKGIQIYFPLSPIFALGLWCKSHFDAIVSTYGIESAQDIEALPQVTQDFLNTQRFGTALKQSPENVTFFNSLQIAQAEQFIFSSRNDFLLAKEMMLGNPELRRGPRLEIT